MKHVSPYIKTEWRVRFYVLRQVCEIWKFYYFWGGSKIMGYLNSCIEISMANKFLNVCLILYNGMLLLQKVLRHIRWELYRGGGTYPEVSMEIVMGINAAGCSHVILGFCWNYPYKKTVKKFSLLIPRYDQFWFFIKGSENSSPPYFLCLIFQKKCFSCCTLLSE